MLGGRIGWLDLRLGCYDRDTGDKANLVPNPAFALTARDREMRLNRNDVSVALRP
jgi:hypothetical protein